MTRPFFLIAILCLCAGAAQGRTTSGSDSREAREKRQPVEKSKPVAARRILFKTNSPRLFATTKPVKPKNLPIRPEPERMRSKVAAQQTISRPIAPTPTLEPQTRPLASTSPLPKRELHLEPASFTPYDSYLGTVRTVIANLDGRHANMLTACELMRAGRRFRYLMTDPYRAQSPAETEAKHAGDCKSKALWLYDQLGDPSAYYVIGKLERRSRTSHAWVYWRCDGRWWILDPTDRATPISAESVASHRYVPYYSYSPAGTFRHKATSLILAMGNGIPAAPEVTAVANRSKSEGTRGLRR